ncbi:MAG: hypothetical protein OXG49_10020 [Chloroflexi bacterium]|nr:hypothetical protein [Chloroflexota bacterium]
MLQTPIMIAPPTAHPAQWPATPKPAWFRAELEKFLPYSRTSKAMPTPTGGNITRARQWYRALSVAVVEALETLPESASAAQVILAVQTAVNADLHDDNPMMKPISDWTRQTVFTHALTAPAQLEAAG